MYTPTAKGYFSGCGGMQIGIMQGGVRVGQMGKWVGEVAMKYFN